VNPATPPFKRQTVYDNPAVVGARWWQEALAQSSSEISRRKLMTALIGLGVGAIGVGALVATCSKSSSASSSSATDDLVETHQDALQLQQELGWNVGAEELPLSWTDAVAVDCDGRPLTGVPLVNALLTMQKDLTPKQTRLVPFWGPTLFSIFGNSAASGLTGDLKPVSSQQMASAFARAQGLASEFDSAKQDLAVILDLPGPEAVAAAAAMSDRFEPVFVFDNWPHPKGVVPAHLVIGAALFFRPILMRSAASRPSNAAPVFVLDSNRLLPYKDEANLFDNRYVARLPSWQKLRELGYKRVLYVRPEGFNAMELDDLNEDFCACGRAEVDVKFCALEDFRHEPPAEAGKVPKPPAAASVPDAGPDAAIEGGTGEAGAPAPGSFVSSMNATPRHYYGGLPYTHVWFWSDYGWSSRRPTGTRPAWLPTTSSYKPSPRITVFTGLPRQPLGMVGRPSGFGTVTVNKSRSSGSAVSVGRSGSMGRVSSSRSSTSSGSSGYRSSSTSSGG